MPTKTSRRVLDQIPGHPRAQSSWHAKSTIAFSLIYSPVKWVDNGTHLPQCLGRSKEIMYAKYLVQRDQTAHYAHAAPAVSTRPVTVTGCVITLHHHPPNCGQKQYHASIRSSKSTPWSSEHISNQIITGTLCYKTASSSSLKKLNIDLPRPLTVLPRGIYPRELGLTFCSQQPCPR